MQALVRDAGRATSGMLDSKIANPTGATTVHTNAVHIIPFCINSNQDVADKACLPSTHYLQFIKLCSNVLVCLV